MKKFFAVFAIVFIVFLTFVGVNTVFADSDCPSTQGWKCVELDGSPSTLGVYIILENKGGIISQVFINGKIYTSPGEKTDDFYLEGIGTERVNILSNKESIEILGWYIQPEETATSVPPVETAMSVPIATLTVTSAVVTTSVVTSTPIVTSTTTPAIKLTPVVTKLMYLYWVIPIGITMIVIAFLFYRKKKH